MTDGKLPDPTLPTPRRRALTFAAQELRLISSLVLLLAAGLFLALPFVLSIGAVVFLPLVTAMMLTITCRLWPTSWPTGACPTSCRRCSR